MDEFFSSQRRMPWCVQFVEFLWWGDRVWIRCKEITVRKHGTPSCIQCLGSSFAGYRMAKRKRLLLCPLENEASQPIASSLSSSQESNERVPTKCKEENESSCAKAQKCESEDIKKEHCEDRASKDPQTPKLGLPQTRWTGTTWTCEQTSTSAPKVDWWNWL